MIASFTIFLFLTHDNRDRGLLRHRPGNHSRDLDCVSLAQEDYDFGWIGSCDAPRHRDCFVEEDYDNIDHHCIDHHLHRRGTTEAADYGNVHGNTIGPDSEIATVLASEVADVDCNRPS